MPNLSKIKKNQSKEHFMVATIIPDLEARELLPVIDWVPAIMGPECWVVMMVCPLTGLYTILGPMLLPWTKVRPWGPGYIAPAILWYICCCCCCMAIVSPAVVKC